MKKPTPAQRDIIEVLNEINELHHGLIEDLVLQNDTEIEAADTFMAAFYNLRKKGKELADAFGVPSNWRDEFGVELGYNK